MFDRKWSPFFVVVKEAHISTIIFMFDINSLEYETKCYWKKERVKKKLIKGRRKKTNYYQAIHTEQSKRNNGRQPVQIMYTTNTTSNCFVFPFAMANAYIYEHQHGQAKSPKTQQNKTKDITMSVDSMRSDGRSYGRKKTVVAGWVACSNPSDLSLH